MGVSFSDKVMPAGCGMHRDVGRGRLSRQDSASGLAGKMLLKRLDSVDCDRCT